MGKALISLQRLIPHFQLVDILIVQALKPAVFIYVSIT